MENVFPQCINCNYCFADIDAVESTTFYWCDYHNHEVFPSNTGCEHFLSRAPHWTFEQDYPEIQLRRMFPQIEKEE